MPKEKKTKRSESTVFFQRKCKKLGPTLKKKLGKEFRINSRMQKQNKLTIQYCTSVYEIVHAL